MEESWWDSFFRRLEEVYGKGGELGSPAPVQIGEGSNFFTPDYTASGAVSSGEAPGRMRAIRANQQRVAAMPDTAPAAPEAQATSDPFDQYLNQLLMASLMKKPKKEFGTTGSLGYGVGSRSPFGDPWNMVRGWEQSYRRV